MTDDTLVAENAELREQVANLLTRNAQLDADVIGCRNIIQQLQKRLRVAEDEASTRRAAARQVEEVQLANGLMTSLVPEVSVEPTVSGYGEAV